MRSGTRSSMRFGAGQGIVAGRAFRCVARRNTTIVPFGRRLTSTTAASTARTSRRVLVGPALVAALIGGYAAAAYTGLENPSAYRIVTKYLPGGESVMDFLEERRHSQLIRSRENFYKRQDTVKPYISKVYASVDEPEPGENSTLSALSATGAKDPLSSRHFFDAGSGTVTTQSRDYLPLILLPDDSDPYVSRVCNSLNDLIASVNASAASEATVIQVSKRLRDLARTVDSTQLESQERFIEKADRLQSIASARASMAPGSYHDQLAAEILETESHLVTHINTRGSLSSVEATFVSSRTPELKKVEFRATDYVDAVIRLQMSFVLLAAAMHNHASANQYIESARKTISQLANPAQREKVVKEALHGIAIPEDVDLGPIINELLRA